MCFPIIHVHNACAFYAFTLDNFKKTLILIEIDGELVTSGDNLDPW